MNTIIIIMLKFICSENATKFCEVTVKSTVEIFVAFSEHMNFNIIMTIFIVFCHAIMIYLKGKVCPNMTCDGILEIQACRGHGGYPVTHFWRHVSTLGILFQVSEFLVQFVNSCFSVLFDITSDSKKPGQTTGVIQYCSLSRFF